MSQVKAKEYALTIAALREKYHATRANALNVFSDRQPVEASDFFGELLRKMGLSFETIGQVVSPNVCIEDEDGSVTLDDFQIRHAFLTWRGTRQLHSCGFEIQIFVEFCINLGFKHVEVLRVLHDSTNAVDSTVQAVE